MKAAINRSQPEWVRVENIEKRGTVYHFDYQTFVSESGLTQAQLKNLAVGLTVFAELDMEKLCRAGV